jgi:hypothetical protein
MAKQNRRTELALADDRHKLAQLALTNPGASSTELAMIYEHTYGKAIKPRTVRYDLQTLKKLWVVENQQTMELMRVNELARVDALEQEVWGAWRASQKPLEKIVVERLHKAVNEAAQAKVASELASELASEQEYVTEEVLEAIIRDAIKDSVEAGEDTSMFIHKITSTETGTIGDPRFLAQIHEIQRERRKIQGVYAPELHQLDIRKVELKGYAGGWSPDEWKEEDVVEGEVSDELQEARKLLAVDDEEDRSPK